METGIYIHKEYIDALIYTTHTAEHNEPLIKFIPCKHEIRKFYLGSIRFLDLKDKPHLQHYSKEGLMQNQFYPLGSNSHFHIPKETRRNLVKQIELCVAKDLSKQYKLNTKITIAATENHHINYCYRLNITPFEPLSLEEYISKLK